MHRLGLYRAASIALGVLSLTCYLIGVSRGDEARHFYIPAVLAAIAAATCVIVYNLERVVERVLCREFAKSRAILAASISRAITDELDSDADAPRHLARVR